MTAPTFEQLLALAGSAEKRRLTPAEAALLRAGLHQAADREKQAKATNAGLQQRIREVKQQAKATATALAATQPYRVPCTHCGAAPGQQCRAHNATFPPPKPHTARLNAAQQQSEEPMTYLRGTALEAAARAAHQRYQAGESMRAIAADTGRSYGYVRKLLVLAGATIRPRGNPHWKETPVPDTEPGNWVP